MIPGIGHDPVSEMEQMHAVYRQGGADRATVPHVIYRDASCPHAGCRQRLQAIDFCLEAFGHAVHDPLVKAWWADAGFAGRCPGCNQWIHFTIRGKRTIDEIEAAKLLRLPDDWANQAIIL